MTVKPMNDRVLIKPDAKEEKTEAGVWIPDTANTGPDSKEEPGKGIVVAVGPGKWDRDGRVPMSCKAGDTVRYSKMAGVDITLESGKYLIMEERNVLAIITA